MESENEKEKLSGTVDVINDIPLLQSKVILGNIVERKIDKTTMNTEFKVSKVNSSKTGFPSVFATEKVLADKNSKQSIFLQSLSNENSLVCANKNVIMDCSTLVTGSWADEIHKENLEVLKNMSNEEILAEKNKLESSIDPRLLAFIRSKKNLKAKNLSKPHKIELETTVYPEKMDIETELQIPDFVKVMGAEGIKQEWVHMDALEVEKLKWMNDLQTEEINSMQSMESYNARFDFNGVLLPYKDESLSVDQGLHHHGEEPSRPGYSVQELLQLSRSATQQQRCIALNTLACIMEKTHNGWYDKVLQPSLLRTLNEKNVLLLLRFSVDDSSIAVITSALQALRAFLFSQTDEVCLDRMFGIYGLEEPELKPEIPKKEKVETYKDHEITQFDVVAAALRTNLILRLRFILSEVSLPLHGIAAALDILTRLARHSKETAINIAATPNLLDILIKIYITPAISWEASVNQDGSRLTQFISAFRLCRVLIAYGGRPVFDRFKNLKFINSVMEYLSWDVKQHVQIATEGLRLCRLLLDKGFKFDSDCDIKAICESKLVWLRNNLNLETASPIKCDYAAAVVAIFACDAFSKTFQESKMSLDEISTLLAKWTAQLNNISTLSWNQSVLLAETIKTATKIHISTYDRLKNSENIAGLFSGLKSNLLSSFKEADKRFPVALPNLCAITADGKLLPVLDSSLPLLTFLLEFFTVNHKKEEAVNMLRNIALSKYLSDLVKYDWSFERSWFTRIEYRFLLVVLKAADSFREELHDENLRSIAIKLTSALPGDLSMDVKFCLKYILNPRLSPNNLRNYLSKLSLDNTCFGFSDNGSLNDAAIRLYEVQIRDSCKWYEASLPQDWVFLPLIDSYSRLNGKDRNNTIWRESDTTNVTIMLGLIIFYPDLIEHLSSTLRFSRLVLLYLCDTAFLHPPQSLMAEKIMSNFITEHYKKLNLSDSIPGLSSFNDLFTALCEHFVAYSYNQNCFSKVVLIFIAQRFDAHFRKLLWSEHADALRYCKLSSDELAIPLREYLYPIEKDVSLIEAYITALVRDTVRKESSPIPYRIALHHSAMFLKSDEKLSKVLRSRIVKLLDDHKLKSVAEVLLNYNPDQ